MIRRALVAAAMLGAIGLQASAQSPGLVEAPVFEVDPLWPKPLPNQWIIGSAIGVAVDRNDHVFVLHRQGSLDPRSERGAEPSPQVSKCCRAAPPVIEFDTAGNVVKAWGGPGPGYTWPVSNHGLAFDDDGNLWTAGNGEKDSHLLKFTPDGKFLAQYGTPGQLPASNDVTHFGKPANVSFNLKTREAFVADGYGNRRVAVLDMATGAVKRYWGGSGARPHDDPIPAYSPTGPREAQFRGPVHCAVVANDGLIYVCDRMNDRVQVFRADGSLVREMLVNPATLGTGAATDIVFSKDPGQKYIFLIDGSNKQVHVVDRAAMTILTSFGGGGRQPGQFISPHSIAIDSKGNLYIAETLEGKRVQKFTYKGIGKVAREQGVVWPK